MGPKPEPTAERLASMQTGSLNHPISIGPESAQHPSGLRVTFYVPRRATKLKSPCPWNEEPIFNSSKLMTKVEKTNPLATTTLGTKENHSCKPLQNAAFPSRTNLLLALHGWLMLRIQTPNQVRVAQGHGNVTIPHYRGRYDSLLRIRLTIHTRVWCPLVHKWDGSLVVRLQVMFGWLGMHCLLNRQMHRYLAWNSMESVLDLAKGPQILQEIEPLKLLKIPSNPVQIERLQEPHWWTQMSTTDEVTKLSDLQGPPYNVPVPVEANTISGRTPTNALTNCTSLGKHKCREQDCKLPKVTAWPRHKINYYQTEWTVDGLNAWDASNELPDPSTTPKLGLAAIFMGIKYPTSIGNGVTARNDKHSTRSPYPRLGWKSITNPQLVLHDSRGTRPRSEVDLGSNPRPNDYRRTKLMHSHTSQ
ncbi:hypothetical protein BS47DRAFT_1369048 [Hydnum rufescens UP504]|uniref:Uncharacterized protein n=1 Tax=Hydnum rufescens UP504 TaxID=1448309 RepID=A0A9P6AFQ0_9AGAM|nr:hypothetical protein BS47DRAFT_1369048 [Hydnum rufescens UP504]